MSEQNKLLLSDTQIRSRALAYTSPYDREVQRTANWVREIYEAQRSKDRELIQTLVLLVPIAQRMQAACDKGDVLNFDNDFDAQDAIDYKAIIDTALALAGEHGYKPTPTHRPK